MKHLLQIVFLVGVSILANNLSAQTLTERLLGENPTRLVELAREKGNIIRGAILFHQGSTNCAKCHRPSAETERIGPDLSRLDQDVTDEDLVESILQPSKSIKKGFETVAALTLDGQLLNGIVVKESDSAIVIRDSENVDRVVTIKREDLDAIRPGTKSSMPEGLADELKNRQQFLDLLRYVMDIKERGPAAEQPISTTVAQRELSSELNGLILMNERNCVACHQSNEIQSVVKAKQAPDLKWSAKWLNPRELSRFIAEPNAAKPGTTMPHLLDHLDGVSRTKTADELVHFLVGSAGNQFQVQPIDKSSGTRGAELFHAVGCVACHSPRDALAQEFPLDDSQPLGNLAQKYNVVGLVSFLEDPHSVRASGRMPKMQLTHGEATDIAHFLLQATEAATKPWKFDSALAKKGADHFSDLKCASCHTGFMEGDPQPGSTLAMDQLKTDQGCLSDEMGTWPRFQFDAGEKESIRTALKRYPMSLGNEQQIEVTLKSFNCTACHDRNDFGGVNALRNPHFQTSNLNLGDQGRIPPTLTDVGAKLKPKWMRDVLVNGRTIRPYMKTRMPQYGEDNIGHLVELFQRTDKISETKFASFDDQKVMRKMGLEMAGNKGLNCVACHTYKYKLSDTMPAVDLTEMAERLKKDWFYQYMLVPQKFSPNTVMPSFWPGGVAIRKDLEGDPEFQIEALWQYLIDGRQAGTPAGVVRKPLEIVVADEARMLRRSYPGIGKRGIGVGYPGGVNLAFDAEQMRLAMLWKGKFADPVGVWSGQGHGNVRPMGRAINLAKGPELDDDQRPWIVDDGRPPNHQFMGYSLDSDQRPTFGYQFDNVKVKDFFSQVSNDTSFPNLRRSVSFSSKDRRENLSFRIASSEKVSDDGDGQFSIGDKLKIKLVSDHKVQIIEGPEGKQLRVSINLEAGKEQELILVYLWN